MKRLFGICIFILFAFALRAQVIVHGSVRNATDDTPVEMATVRLFIIKPGDSIMVQGAQTDMAGEYYLGKVYPGEYKLYISSVGFIEQFRQFTVKTEDVHLPVFKLEENIQVLGELDVRGHAAEMTVKGDTIEYNTSAYNLQENAMVEDLLKKMNGIQVDKEGNVTVNGEAIKGVRIDGKKFFGDDVQTATKNIPADMIEKVQVIDEKSETAKLTGFEDDETERIINLKLKQNRKKGVFGNYNAGIGMDMVGESGKWFDYTRNFLSDDFRYEAGLFTNILSGASQTTIIGSANNTNQIRMGRGRGGFGSQNEGITWSENVGVNTNIDLSKQVIHKDDQSSLVFGGDVAFSHAYNDAASLKKRNSYSNDANYQNIDSTQRFTKSWDVNMRLELEYQIDTLNKLLFQPRLSYTNTRSDNVDEFTYYRDSILLNHGNQHQISNSEDIGAGLKLIYNRKFLRPGRSLTITGDMGITNNKGKSSNLSWDYLFDRSQVDQYTNSGNNQYNYSLRTSYVEPVHGNNHLMEFALSFSGNNRNSYKDQMARDNQNEEYLYDDEYSNRLTNGIYSEGLEVNYRYIEQKFDLTVGARVLATQTHSKTYYGGLLYRDTLFNVWNWSPNASFKYKFGKKQFARIIYRGTVQNPSISQMEPVRNNSDAMNETLGNLSLNPAFRHNLRFMFSKFNTERMSSIMAGLRANLTKDALVNNTIYDETGKVYHQTVNANALPYDVGADFMYNTPLAKNFLQFHTRTAISYNQRIAYTSAEKTAQDIAISIANEDIMLGDLSRTGNLQLSEELNLRFVHDIVDLGVGGSFSYSRTHNTINANNTTNVFNWNVTGDIEFHLPKNWTIAADCGYTARYGYHLDNPDELLLNVQINKSWKSATLALKAFDLLNNKKNIVEVISDNSVEYKQFNTLPTYFLLTFTYKFNKMGDMKAKGMAGHMQDMIESGFDPSKGPKGPPPAMPPGPPPGM